MRSALVVLALTASLSPACADKAPPIKVGIIASLDPVGASWTGSANLGFQAAADEINRGGGIRGRKLHLLFEDDRFDPKRALAAYEKLTKIDGVDFLIGPQFEQTLSAVLPVAQREKRLIITTIASTPANSMRRPLVIHSIPPDKLAAKCLAEAIKADGRKKPLILTPQEAYSQTFARFLSEALQDVDWEQIDYLPDAPDYQQLLLRAKTKKPDALVFFFVTAEAAIAAFRKLGELDFHVPIYSNEVLHESKELLEKAGRLTAGAKYCLIPFDPSQPAIGGFLKKLPAKPILPMYAVAAYDTMRWLAQLIEQEGVDQAAVHRAVFSQAYEGLLTKYAFDEFGDLTFQDFVVYEVDVSGYRPAKSRAYLP